MCLGTCTWPRVRGAGRGLKSLVKCYMYVAQTFHLRGGWDRLLFLLHPYLHRACVWRGIDVKKVEKISKQTAFPLVKEGLCMPTEHFSPSFAKAQAKSPKHCNFMPPEKPKFQKGSSTSPPVLQMRIPPCPSRCMKPLISSPPSERAGTGVSGVSAPLEPCVLRKHQLLLCHLEIICLYFPRAVLSPK